MGQLVAGVWKKGWYEPDARGAFVRPDAVFKKCREHPAEPGRYHLYVSYACPWAHRTIITRALRGLEGAVSMTVVDPHMGDDGWQLSADDPDPLFGSTYLREIYTRAKPDYTGRVTVPVLWDKKDGAIVCNESREVMRLLDVDFEAMATKGASLAPPELRARIDEILTAIYEPINDGVYRAGFATRQRPYEDAVKQLFHELARWDGVLAKQRFVTGDAFTEADIALFTTLLRFDLVYYSHFKCNVRRLRDHANLWRFVREVYAMPDVRETCRLDHIKVHYYWSQTTVNPYRIVPLGPSEYERELAE